MRYVQHSGKTIWQRYYYNCGGIIMGTEKKEREIGHDEYDPVGTVALIILYFVVVVVMWLVMFFVEFLDGGPTVVG